ncbi:Uncharacterized protein HDE_05045 [Halotydeus destructor]|nr:Uncharacterized protein HDE_05045 [Halotydeus destructor]
MRKKQLRELLAAVAAISPSPTSDGGSAASDSAEDRSTPSYSCESDSDDDSAIVVGPTGSVRGRRHCVRKSVRAFLQEEEWHNRVIPEASEGVIMYSTSMGVIRETFENCRKLRAILFQNWISFEERDVYLHEQYRKELEVLLRENKSSVIGLPAGLLLPCVFIQGRFLGTVQRVEQLNEEGQLRSLLGDFVSKSPLPPLSAGCPSCGGARFIPCPACNGSKKSYVRHFLSDSIALRCSACHDSKAGLVRCPACASCPSSASLGSESRYSPLKINDFVSD